ncbi:hemolymph lipopolysaccharide-binding protein [Fopius arisanus]|uniref:Hemolymph lipopolysaccharide-binding protein n=1 Tax=Fopius arisanus TaxID=64838 RepID=A0A9R1TJ14_9HYME|nr:PREDICTED: hemolymph lipopolysaccharide-binding protein-like [Fopius arisanus]
MINNCNTGLIVIVLLIAVGARDIAGQCPPVANGFIVNSLQGNGYNIRSSQNPNEFFVNTANGLELRVIIGQSGFLISGNDANGRNLTANPGPSGQVEFVANATGSGEKKLCEGQSFPAGYKVTMGIGAHKYYKTKKSWNDARNTCVNDGGHLLVITSDAEEKVILNMVNAAGDSDTWLGIHDLFVFRDWVTIQDVRLNATGYARWSPRIVPNPDNYGGNQRCVRLLNTGGMDDIQCTSSISFVCKIQCNKCLASPAVN